jgi:hypothetical protein
MYLFVCSVVFVYMICIFMIYSTSYSHSKLWIHRMSVCMYLCVCVGGGMLGS